MHNRRYGAAIAGIISLGLLSGGALAEPKTNMLHQWDSGSDAAAIAKLGEMFTAAGGKWEQTSIAGHTANTLAKLRADVIAGNAPPAVQLKGPEIAEWNATGMTADLDAQAKEEGWEKVVAPELLPVMKPTGVWVAAPMNIHRINWIWGSTKAMAKAGITALPKTWAEFNADCDKAVAAKVICLAHFSQDWTDATTFEVVVYGQDIDLFRKAFVEGDTKALRSPEMIKAFDQYRLMISKYMDPAIAGRDFDTANGMLGKGEAAFMIMGDWEIGMLTAAGLKQGGDYVCQQAPTDWRFRRVLQAEGPGLHRRPEAACASDPVASVPDGVQPGQGLNPRASRRRPLQRVQPVPAALEEGSAGLHRRRHLGPLDGA
jgi:glucose/mannose transport system substrate-binding protein